jgi:hypothetical protein
MTTFKVGDLVIRKPEYINDETTWKRDCEQRGLDPYAPTRVRGGKGRGILVEAPNRAIWVREYFHLYVP